ncbi:MAG: phage portal protein, partial [Proteobacteria bacterium]|nr:phage portal protein [Pseudomonadota bacterium]
ADRLAADAMFPRLRNQDNGNEIRRGVEIDANGRTVAYWLYPRPPSDLNTLISRPKRHEAKNFLHLFNQKRIGQTRGVSDFAPIVQSMKDLNFYIDNEMQASAISSSPSTTA